MNHTKRGARWLALMGMMLAMITVMSALEHSLPPIPFLPPNIRLGLSNIITMYVLFFVDRSSAVLLNVLKSLFVLFMRGTTAGLLSFCGGIVSILAVILLLAVFRDHLSYLILSVAGAIFHNLGQIVAASFLLKTNIVLYYLPVLIVFGSLTGFVTGTTLRVVMPLFDKMLDKRG